MPLKRGANFLRSRGKFRGKKASFGRLFRSFAIGLLFSRRYSLGMFSPGFVLSKTTRPGLVAVGVLGLGLAASACSGDAQNEAFTARGGTDAGGSGNSGAAAGAFDDPLGDAGGSSVGGTTGSSGSSVSPGTSGSAGSGGAEPEPPCVDKSGLPGLHEGVEVDVDGTKRTFDLYVPSGIDPEEHVPIVFAHHGASMTGKMMRVLTEFNELADTEGFIVAFPNGVATTWQSGGLGLCGLGTLAPGIADDLGFVEAMIDHLDDTYCVDRKRTLVTGFSMGGYFSNYIGCSRPDLVTAIGPHSGGGPPDDCEPGPKPVMIMHGTLDLIIRPGCGPEARDKWVEHNGCSTDVETETVKGGHCERSLGCPPGGQVVYCEFKGMIHGWAGHNCGFPTCILPYGGGDNYEDATRLVYDFFKEQW